jgi:protein-disulfide isomerase
VSVPSSDRAADETRLPTLVLPVGDRDQRIHGPGSKYTLVEYGDFECPDCAQGFHVVQELLRDLGDDLCFVFRHFPMAEEHPHALAAAEAAEAAGMQGKFWLMHDRLFEHQGELGPATIRKLAEDLPVDRRHFDRDLASGAPRRKVAEDRAGGKQAGVEDTPTFFVNGRMYVGSHEYRPLYDALTRPAPSGEPR